MAVQKCRAPGDPAVSNSVRAAVLRSVVPVQPKWQDASGRTIPENAPARAAFGNQDLSERGQPSVELIHLSRTLVAPGRSAHAADKGASLA